MNHQPYETWILDDQPTAQKERNELEQHLKDCPDCIRLSESWKRVDKALSNPVVAPAPAYFLRDWKANLAIRKFELERRRKRNLMVLLGSVALVILFILAALLVPGVSIISISVALISSLVALLNTLENLITLIVRSIQQVPPRSLIITTVILSSWFLFATVAWGVSIWKLATQRRQVS